MFLIPASFLQLTWTSCRRGYIIIWQPLFFLRASQFRTQFNPSTVKVISWYSSTGCTCYLHRCISYFDSLAGSEVNIQNYNIFFNLTPRYYHGPVLKSESNFLRVLLYISESESEIPVLGVWRMWSTLSLTLLSGSLWNEVIVRIASMEQMIPYRNKIELFNFLAGAIINIKWNY